MRGNWFRTVVAGRALLVITVAQLVEIAAWVPLFHACGEFDDLPAAFRHSARELHDVRLLSPAWKILGPLEADAGTLMFGVSTAVLFAVIQTLIRREPALEVG